MPNNNTINILYNDSQHRPDEIKPVLIGCLATEKAPLVIEVPLATGVGNEESFVLICSKAIKPQTALNPTITKPK